MKSVLITGSNGLLGQNLVKLLRKDKDVQVFALSKGENRIINKEGYIYYGLDISESKALKSLIFKINPDFIIHTAAITNVDDCELNKDRCDRINVEAVEQIANCCEELSIHLIHISTDFIFDGEKGPYSEKDIPNPINYYGLSKLKAEEVIINKGIDYTILRTILVYGLTDDLKNNIVLWVIDNLKNKRKINVVTDQLRMPTLVDDLADACLFSLKNNIKGIYNVSSNQLISIYDMTIEIANTFDLDKFFINPVTSSEFNQPAKRPPVTGFDLTKSISELNLLNSSFSERLQVFKNQLKRVGL